MTNAHLDVWYTEAQNELRWRREVEYKLLNANITFYGLITAGVGLSDVTGTGFDSLAFANISKFYEPILISMVFLSLSILSIIKVWHDNKAYKNIGQAVVKWVDEVKFPKQVLPDNFDRYGLGRGYMLACFIIFFTSLVSSAIVWVKYLL